MTNTTDTLNTDLRAAEAAPDKKRKGEWTSAFKGAVVGSAGAFLLSAALFSAQPTQASATVLLPSLGTIIQQITTYYNLMVQYVDQWKTILPDSISDQVFGDVDRHLGTIENAINTVNRGHAADHARGDAAPVQAINTLIGQVQNSDGTINPGKAAEYLLPPVMEKTTNLSEDDVNRIRDHALMLTQDQPIPPARAGERGTVSGTAYEYQRLNTLQQRFLAQDAITQYPMAGPKLAAYQEYLESVQNAGVGSSMTPGQILSSQLAVMSKVAIPAALDGLESDLRRERLLGAQLAALANQYHEQEGRRMARSGQ